MLHKVKNAHREILRGLPELKALLPPSVNKKRRLLEMAARGEPRPSRTTGIGQALSNYTTKDSDSEDPQFARKIRSLAPRWFTPSTELNKVALVAAARRGEPKPKDHTKLRKVFYTYTTEKSVSYDPEFTKKIMKIAPHWFATISQRNKEILLDEAKRGGPRPKQRTKAGATLSKYTREKSAYHDPDFVRKIRRIAPHWFFTRFDAADQKKRALADMARTGLERPKAKTEMGMALYRYSSRTSDSHDPAFTKRIKKLAPHWFERCSTR